MKAQVTFSNDDPIRTSIIPFSNTCPSSNTCTSKFKQVTEIAVALLSDYITDSDIMFGTSTKKHLCKSTFKL